MIVDKPRPKYPYPAPRLPGVRQRMTLIGAIRAGCDVVLLADRQETITDYAKWDCSKISHLELQDTHRILCAGAGYSDVIDMVRDSFREKWATMKKLDSASLKKAIVQTVSAVMKQAVMPLPKDERPSVELIWVIQQIAKLERPVVFRTRGFAVNDIPRYYFAGNPILLSRFLSDMYLERQILTLPVAEALAAYILWECKEYDPTVGKHSDVVSLGLDGKLRRMSREEESYWEEHFFELKKAMKIMPILSSADSVMKAIYDKDDWLARFGTTLSVLTSEQDKLRAGNRKTVPLRGLVESAVRRDYQRRTRVNKKSSKLLASQT